MKKKKCKNCGKEFEPRNSLQPVCNYVCALAYNDKKQVEKRFKELKRKVKEGDSVKLLTNLAKSIAQKYARLRDAHLGCISCNNETATVYHGGHLFKSELYSGVRFHEFNIHKQCAKCNVFLNGNEVNYVAGFIKRYGQELFDLLSTQARESKIRKWEKEELLNVINFYKLKIKELEPNS